MTPELTEIYDEYSKVRKRLSEELKLENTDVDVIEYFKKKLHRLSNVFITNANSLINEKIEKNRKEKKENEDMKSEEQKKEEKEARKKERIEKEKKRKEKQDKFFNKT